MKDNKQIFEDHSLPVDERIKALISELTLEEKISQMCHNSKPISRLGIPEYNWWNECLHGVARAGLATVFPQSIGLAATFDTDLMFRVASAISDEARAKHHDFVKQGRREIYQGLTYWTPNINIFRDPRWGRGMETYGEDPYLTGRLAVEFVKGLQGDHEKYLKLVATPKHFAVHSGPESLRHEFDAIPSKKDLYETYFPAFEACVKEANAQSIMGAYNRLYGEACCASPFLLSNVLREEWGFDGYVVSDCGAIFDIYAHHKIVKTPAEAAALAIKSGNDLNCGSVYCDLVESVKLGLINENEIDLSLERLFRARFKLGMFDPLENNPYAQISYHVVDSDKHRELAVEAAQKSFVLLKNENNLLPLGKDKKKIAVIGPHILDEEIYLGNYHGMPSSTSNLLEGIKSKVGEDVEIMYEQGCPLAEGLPYMTPVPGEFLFTSEDKKVKGIKVSYFENAKFEGEPSFTEITGDLNYNCSKKFNTSYLSNDKVSYCWEGYIVPPVTGKYALGVAGMYSVRFWFDGKLMEDYSNIWEPEKIYFNFDLEEGIPHHIKIEMYSAPGDIYIQQLIWSLPDPTMEERAVNVAKKSDVVIMALGLSSMLEGEELRVHVKGFNKGDREHLNLPGIQEDLLRKIHATGTPVILVLFCGSAVAVNFAQENIDSILLAWYPGQSTGIALSDVLFGKISPSGKLPVTFYKSEKDLPPFDDYSMQERTYRYMKKEPLYPFGFGLSYTSFEYSGFILEDQKITKSGQIKAMVQVANTGNMDGEEVVQLYVAKEAPVNNDPIFSLKSFKRIKLAKGESKTIEFQVTGKMMESFDDDGNAIIAPGKYKIYIGGSCPLPRGIQLKGSGWKEGVLEVI